MRVVATLVVLAVVVVVLAWAFQRQLIYLPAGHPAATAEQVLAGGSAVIVHTEDGLDLTAWHAPATGPAIGTSVLVLPGNAGSRAARVPLARALSAVGFDVLLLDYRGYGGNPGSPTEQGLAADARAAHHYLVADRGVPLPGWCCLGRVWGGGRQPPRPRTTGRGAGTASLFTSLADVGALHYPLLPVRALLRDRYPVRDMVGSITVPITVVAGEADEVAPPAQSRAVGARRPRGIRRPGAGHNDRLESGAGGRRRRPPHGVTG